MIVNTKAIVISTIKYSEADLIVKCFTKSEGLKTYLLKGVLKSKKGKFRAAYFQPLTLLEITANHKNKGKLEYFSEVKIDYPFSSLHNHIVKSSLVLFLSEVLKQCIVEEETNIAMFDYICQSLIWLDQNNELAHFHLLFLLNLTHYLGFYPDTINIKHPIFNLEEGIFQTEFSSVNCVEIDTKIPLFKTIFGINFDALHGLKSSKLNRKRCLKLILDYYAVHLQGFKEPKSIQILDQIFSS